MELMADALHVDNVFSKQAPKLDLRILRILEYELNVNEQISILFLILDNHECLNELLRVLQSDKRTNIISAFVDRISGWQEKIIEALCIVNNRRLLHNLGLCMGDLELQYFPKYPRISSHIKVGAKILYSLFDQLNDKKAELLLNSVYKDVPEEIKLKDIKCLEIHALYWHSIGKISIESDYGNFAMLLQCVKRLGFLDTPLYCDIEQYSIVKPLKNINASSEVATKHVLKHGLCIIINEENFPGTEYESRDSSRLDTVELQKTFKGLGFDVQVYTDLSRDEILHVLELHSSENAKNYDCLLVCLLSHGYSGGFISREGCEINFETIERQMCSRAFRNSVKILIVQACQGKTKALAEATPNLTIDGLPSHSARTSEIFMEYYKSFFLFTSTMNNFISVRHRHKGSWFIQELCKVLQSRKIQGDNISIDQWSKEVKRNVQAKRGELGDGTLLAQLPESRDRLTEDVYFPIYGESHLHN